MKLYEIKINDKIFRIGDNTLDLITSVLLANNSEESHQLLNTINSQRNITNVVGICITAQDHIEGDYGTLTVNKGEE